MQAEKRLDSIDALRGLTVAAMLVVNDAGDWNHVFPWLDHAAWNGCNPADLIFPFFMLIVGVSIELALGRKLDGGAARGPLLRAVLLRGMRIVLLGLVLHLAATLMLPERPFRLLGVMQRIGICFALAGARRRLSCGPAAWACWPSPPRTNWWMCAAGRPWAAASA